MQGARRQFASHGLGIASISYDAPAVLAAFAARKRITFPLLADPGSRLIRRFRMVDPDNTENNVPSYGARDTAYPGYFVVSPAGVVTERFVDGRYDDRRTGNAVAAALFPGLIEPGGPPVRAPHLELRTGQSDAAVNLGSRVQLLLELKLPPGVHVYAPGVKDYRPLEIAFDASPWFSALQPRFPAPQMLHLEAIGETVPVYEGKPRLVVDAVVANTTALMRAFANAPGVAQRVTLSATLRYQACDEKVCFKPAEVAVAWTLLVKLPEMGRTAR